MPAVHFTHARLTSNRRRVCAKHQDRPAVAVRIVRTPIKSIEKHPECAECASQKPKAPKKGYTVERVTL